MYCSIFEDEWMAAGQPALTEVHGWLMDQQSNVVYGTILNEMDQAAVVKALIERRYPSGPSLPLDY